MKKLIFASTLIVCFLLGFQLAANRSVRLGTSIPEREKFDRQGESEATHALEAMQWYSNQRAYPTGVIPLDWRFKALKHIRQSNLPKVSSASTSTLSWTSVGPNNLGGRVRSIVINSLNHNTLYCGSVSGGIWKTTNAGALWFPVSDDADNLVIGTMVMDPGDTNTIYAGTGEGYANVDALKGVGVLKSTDGGGTWVTQTNFSPQPSSPYYVNKLVVQPDHPQTLFAAMIGGIWKTTDGGGSWVKLNFSTLSTACVDLAMDPTNSSILYAAFGLQRTDGIYKTTNGGGSWAKLTNGFYAASIKYTRISLAIAPSDPQTIYASVADSIYGTEGIQKSTDGGGTWFEVAHRQPYDSLLQQTHMGNQGWYDNVIAVHPVNPSYVYAGGNNMFMSTNGGTNWRMLTYGYPPSSHPFMHVDQHAIVFDPTNASIMYFGNDGGVYKSTSGGVSVSDLNNNLSVTQFYSGAVDPINEIYYGGTQDIGIVKSATTPAWSIPFTGDAGVTIVDFNTPTTVYSEYVFLDVLKSTNSGQNWVKMISGIPQQGSKFSDGTSDRCDFIAPVFMDPTNSQHLIGGTYKVYSTTNGGTSWVAASGDLTGDGPGTQGASGGVISALAISKSAPSTWYAGTGFIYSGYGGGVGLPGFAPTKVWVTTNSGGTWDSIDGGLLPNRYVRAIAIDPTNQNRVFVCYSGYGTGHVFRTTNRGASWADVSSNLPDIPANAIVIDPTSTAHLVLGTDLGIFESFDDGTSWVQQNTGLANVAVIDLDLRNDQYLFATTHGRGVFKSQAPISSPLSVHLGIKIHQNPVLTPYIDAYLFSDTPTIPSSASMKILIGSATQDSIPLTTQSSPQVFKGSYHFTTSGTAIVSAIVDDAGGNQMYTQRGFQVQVVKQGIAQTLRSADGIAKISIPENTVPEDMYFTIIPDIPTASESYLLGNKYEFGPGREFPRPMNLTMSYDPARVVPAKEENLTIMQLIDTQWVALESWRDPTTKTITTSVNSLGVFAVGYGDKSHSHVLPEVYTLGQNYPNPFNPSTRISYTIPSSADVKVEVFDIAGSRVASLINQSQVSGEHEVIWEGRNDFNLPVASGVYFYRLTVTNGDQMKFVATKKMILIK